MTAADHPAPDRPIRWGLAAKLFAILFVLGTVAVAVTGVLGYLRARAALEETIYQQLTAAHRTKARQVESYFQGVRSDLRLLASTKMVVEASRGFQAAIEALERSEGHELRQKVANWYAAEYMPMLRRLLGKEPPIEDYLPVGLAATYLQYHYVVANPHPGERRRLLDNPGDGSAYSDVHAVFHPLLRSAAATVGFDDLNLVDAKTGRVIYGVAKEVDFATSLHVGPYRRSTLAAAVAQCLAAGNPSATCLEDFAPYLPAGGAPTAFMASPVIDGGNIIAVLVAELSDDEIDKVVTGDRQWRREGFGSTGEAYLVGPDHFLRSGVRLFYENRDAYYAQLAASGMPREQIDEIKRYDTPILHQSVRTAATHSALAGTEGTGEVIGYHGQRTLAAWAPLSILGVKWALIAKIDSAEAFAPVERLERELLIAGGIALAAVLLVGAWLAHSLMGPLRELTAGVRRFAAGSYDVKVPIRAQDEIGQLCTAFNGMVDELQRRNVVIENKNRENEELLLNVLPAPIANRLRGGENSIADGFAEVTVAFADLVGFTALSSEMPPQDVVTLLNGLFTRFDVAAQELGIEKIKTVGDAYMAVCGLPSPVPNHAERVLRMAIRMVHITREHALEHRVTMRLRVGVNSGPVVAGVIGKSKYIYDLWGDTVNLASRMESAGLPDAIQVTRPVYDKLKDLFVFESRGAIEIKGKGLVESWLLRV